MDISEIRNEKVKLELRIFNLLNEFERQTETQINDVVMHHRSIIGRLDGQYTIEVNVFV